MSGRIILQVILFGIALSMDAFAVSITDGLIYRDISKKKSLFIASVFGVMQALMPLIGYWLVELVKTIAGASGGDRAIKIVVLIVTWLAFALLILIGLKMLIEGIKAMQKAQEEKKSKLFNIKEVLLFGIATSIDALAVGVSLHAGVSNNVTIFLHVTIIMVITFALSFVGTQLGGVINKLLKGKYEISCVIGGCILILLGVWVVLSHYLGI